MNWIVLIVLLAWSAVPITLLVADRVADVESGRLIRLFGWPFILGSAALLVVVGFAEPEYLELVGWGAFVGLLGTISLDVIRLIGLRFGAFPLDMPLVFGMMATGRVQRFQHMVMGRVLLQVLAAETLDEFVRVRVGFSSEGHPSSGCDTRHGPGRLGGSRRATAWAPPDPHELVSEGVDERLPRIR